MSKNPKDLRDTIYLKIRPVEGDVKPNDRLTILIDTLIPFTFSCFK